MPLIYYDISSQMLFGVWSDRVKQGNLSLSNLRFLCQGKLAEKAMLIMGRKEDLSI